MTRMCARNWLTIGAIALVIAAPLWASTSTTISIDGDMSDWDIVLVDPENAMADAASFAGDPDNPNGDRDLRGFAFTWDDQNLYFWLRRTLSGNNSISFSVYLDLDFDGLMSSSDRVARYRFTGASFQSAELVAYDDGGTPDPITGDGVPMPGGFGAPVAAVMGALANPSGIQLECAVDWASLGVAPGVPLNFHVSAGSNNNIEDNMEAFDSLYSRIDLRRDETASAPPGGDALLPHVVRNDGNGDDAINLLVEATKPWDHALWNDPDGDGDPADGVRMALDANGDGDYDDPFDIPPDAVYDADGDTLVDTGLLGPSEEFHFVLVVTPPASAPNGDIDQIVLAARSSNVPSVQTDLEDHVTAGTMTIFPDRSAIGPAGEDVDHPHEVCNFSGSDDIAAFDVSSLGGWTGELRTDPDGDGNGSDGVVLSDDDGDTRPELAVPAGACLPLVLRVSVPPAAVPPDQDTHEIALEAQGSGLADRAFDVTAVAGHVSVAPDRSGDVPVGGTVFYRHIITNGLGYDEIFDLTTLSSLGSTVEVFEDPDQDGIPEGDDAIVETPPIGRNGGSLPVVIRVQVPAATVHGQQDVVTLTAAARSNPVYQDAARDTTTVVNLLTFSDPLFGRAATSFFGPCSTVYAEGSGLPTNEDYRFLWDDPDTFDGPERVTGIREPDDDGLVDDAYTLTAADLAGTWTVRLQQRSGSSWQNLAIGGARNFEVQGGGGILEALIPAKEGVFVQGDSLAVTMRLDNPSDIDFFETNLRYVVFQDQDADGVPSVGEPYILPDGTSDVWAPGAFTWRTQPVEVLRGGKFLDFWRVSDIQFPISGDWTVHATWRMDCGTVIDTLSTAISVCAVLPVADAGPGVSLCRGDAAVVGTAGQPGHSYLWRPADDLDDPTLAQPTTTPSENRTYTLVVVEEVTGCSNSDVLDVVVLEPPDPDILPDAPVINVGGSVTLDAGPGASYSWSSNPPGEPGDGATTRTIDVSPSQTTTYSVEVVNADGCQALATETVTVNPNPPEPVILAGPDTTVCQGVEVTLDAGVAVPDYLWTTDPPGQPGDGATTRSIVVAPSETTTYSVTATDSVGQEGSDSVVIAVLTTTPGSLGPSLRVARDDLDVQLAWQSVPDGWSYPVYRDDRSDWSTPALRQEVVPTDWTDPAAVDGVRLYLYNVHGKACFEGPR